MTTSENTVKAP